MSSLFVCLFLCCPPFACKARTVELLVGLLLADCPAAAMAARRAKKLFVPKRSYVRSCNACLARRTSCAGQMQRVDGRSVQSGLAAYNPGTRQRLTQPAAGAIAQRLAATGSRCITKNGRSRRAGSAKTVTSWKVEVRRQVPTNCGLRLSKKALIPSRKSAVPAQARKASCSACNCSPRLLLAA